MATAGTFCLRLDVGMNGTPSTTDSYSAWGFQCEAGSVATPYIPTLDATVTVTDYSLGTSGSSAGLVLFTSSAQPYAEATIGTGNGSQTVWTLSKLPTDAAFFRTDWQGKQLLYSTSRTNYVYNSQDLTGWDDGSGTTRTANAGAAPDGTTTATQIAATSGARIFRDVSAGTAGQVTLSAWVKLVSGSGNLTVRIKDKSTDVIRGTADFTPTSSWQRVSVTATTTGTGLGRAEFAFPAGLTVLVWGAQFEPGISATGYIPTTTAAASKTDYTLSGLTLTMGTAPLSGATLSHSGYIMSAPSTGQNVLWTGSYREPQVGFRALVKGMPKVQMRAGIPMNAEITFMGYDILPTPVLPVVVP